MGERIGFIGLGIMGRALKGRSPLPEPAPHHAFRGRRSRPPEATRSTLASQRSLFPTRLVRTLLLLSTPRTAKGELCLAPHEPGIQSCDTTTRTLF